MWAIADCYGIHVNAEEQHRVCLDALPRLRNLFSGHGISATLFVVGRDIESPEIVHELRRCIEAGHEIANHSYSHRLDFRNLTEEQLNSEISKCEDALLRELQCQPTAFRAPGYGYSKRLLQVLKRRGYHYDSSLMPGPYGSIFRWMDRRMQQKAGTRTATKTQYSKLTDTKHPLLPHRIHGVWELPVATSPLLRLPFQAGVCMRMGRRYFDAQLRSFEKRPELPLLFLLHAADIADFTSVAHPFFKQPGYFAMPVGQKQELLEYFLGRISTIRQVMKTEEWLGKEIS